MSLSTLSMLKKHVHPLLCSVLKEEQTNKQTNCIFWIRIYWNFATKALSLEFIKLSTDLKLSRRSENDFMRPPKHEVWATG